MQHLSSFQIAFYLRFKTGKTGFNSNTNLLDFFWL